MGKAIRWLKALFGLKKDRDPKDQSNSGDRKDKTPSCIGRSRRDPTSSPAEAPLLKSGNNSHSEEQNKHAIAVAAATAAAADAAVAAAQAAVAVVRLTSQGRVAITNCTRENSAAIKIQALFRGYLCRKALKALKSLVKLQAVVRGYLVRKEAAETLHGMEALFRAQSSVCAQKFRLQDEKSHSNFHPRRSIKRADEARSRRISTSFQTAFDEKPHPIEVDPGEPKSRLTRANTWAWAPDLGVQTHFSGTHDLLIPSLSNHHEFESQFSTTQNTPRCTNSSGSNSYGLAFEGVSKDDSFTSHPGYMANTKSFRAKVRSHSAPKQRPDIGLVVKKRVTVNEMGCGPSVEKSNSSPLEVNHFKNFVMSRIGRSS